MKQSFGILGFLMAFMLCEAVYSQSQPEMNEKSLAEFQKADARLNVTYKKLLADLDADGKKKLVIAERAWVAYRDAQADFEADQEARGGSMAPLIYNTACLELTEARIKELGKAIAEE
jgi:uncharacterized protein YecT (DUF1311 family)